MKTMLRIAIGVIKAIDRSRISVVPVVKVAKKARMIATRNNSSKPTAVFMLTLRDPFAAFKVIHRLYYLLSAHSLNFILFESKKKSLLSAIAKSSSELKFRRAIVQVPSLVLLPFKGCGVQSKNTYNL